jgi:hypothetical protein
MQSLVLLVDGPVLSSMAQSMLAESRPVGRRLRSCYMPPKRLLVLLAVVVAAAGVTVALARAAAGAGVAPLAPVAMIAALVAVVVLWALRGGPGRGG